jgi:hypothetical protein
MRTKPEFAALAPMAAFNPVDIYAQAAQSANPQRKRGPRASFQFFF